MINLNNIPTVTQLETRGGNQAQNQYHIQQDSRYIFQSYNSIICIIDYSTKTICFGRDWDYSRTTLIYLYQFLNNNNIYLSNKKEVENAMDEGSITISTISRGIKWTIQYDQGLV